MPSYVDDVKVRLAGSEVIALSEYEIVNGVFEQPGGFTATIGRPYEFRYLAEQFPPKTPYEVFVNETLVQTGLTDGFAHDGRYATRIHLRGRDPLAKLVDTELDAEYNFSESTYYQLTTVALKRSGLETLLEKFGLRDITLLASNDANRVAVTGTKAAKNNRRKVTEEILTFVGATETTGSKRVYRTIRAEVGETWWQFLVRQYRRVGLFMWSAADGGIVLSTPLAEQDPIYALIRQVGENNILNGSFTNDTTQRHTECIVHGKAEGGKDGVNKVIGRFIDDEMVAYLNPLAAERADGGVIKLVKTVRDNEVKTKEHAQNLARRYIAEERRAGWRLSYTVEGHSLPLIDGEGRANIWPDTLVDVSDEHYGVYGPMYIESIRYSGRPGNTTTTMSLLRPDDLFFRAEEESTKKAVPAKKRLPEKGINTTVAIAAIGQFGGYDPATGQWDEQGRLRPEFATGGFSYPESGLDTLERRLKSDGVERPEEDGEWGTGRNSLSNDYTRVDSQGRPISETGQDLGDANSADIGNAALGFRR